jgi:IrrE N-terminal-like domain
VTRKQVLAKFCVEEVEKLAHEDGFVPIRALAKRFRAKIILRPLLVEAMLASHHGPVETDEPIRNSEWLVLLDNEQYPFTNQDIEREGSSRPLTARLRNTVAHELAHSLIFRAEEFGFNIQLTPKKREDRKSFLKRIEREAEQLSPLMLIPQSRIATLSRRPSLELSDLENLADQCGASREVLINRLGLLSTFDPETIHLNSGLRNVAVGLGEWINRSEASLNTWPLFINFDDGRLPEFLSKLRNHELPLRDVTVDGDFWPNGGSSSTTAFEVNDSPDQPHYMRMRVRMTVEQTDRKANSRFLFLVNKI